MLIMFVSVAVLVLVLALPGEGAACDPRITFLQSVSLFFTCSYFCCIKGGMHSN